ncbi:MAG: hypothetical protein ACLRSW_08575 [Christensenellaceae bacterium]
MVYETFTDMLYKLKHYQDQIIGSLLYFFRTITESNESKSRTGTAT